MAVRLSCPTCNTEFTLPRFPENRRALCPRCGDEFPIRGWREEADDGVRLPGKPPVGATTSPKPLAFRPPSPVLLVILPLMLVGLGVALALWVAQHHKPLPTGDTTSRRPDEVIAATELSGIGYLSADTNLAFAVQPGPVLAYASRTHQDPRELILKMGVPSKVLDPLLNLGITLDQIDHIAGGTCFGDAAAEIRFTLVLTLRTPPTDEADLLRRLKARAQPKGRGLTDVQFGEFPMSLARVSPTVWVFGADAKKDLDAVTKGGHGTGCKHLPASLFQMIAKEVPEDAPTWVATSDERWAEKPGVRLLVETILKKPEWLDSIKHGRAAMVAVSVDEHPRLRIVVKTADTDSAEKLRAFLAKRAARDEKIHLGATGETVFFDTPIDPAKAFLTVEQLLGEPRKE